MLEKNFLMKAQLKKSATTVYVENYFVTYKHKPSVTDVVSMS